jgi:hypothetical protein
MIEHFALAPREFRGGITFGKLRREFRLFRVERPEFAAALRDRVDLPVDVRVVDSDDSESESRRDLPARRGEDRCRELSRKDTGGRQSGGDVGGDLH